MSSAAWAKKNWDAIAAELSSGEDSDAGDDLNVLAVQRNAHRVSELLHGTMPGLDESDMRTLPRGTNTLGFLKRGFENAIRASGVPAGAAPRTAAGTGPGPASASAAPSAARPPPPPSAPATPP